MVGITKKYVGPYFQNQGGKSALVVSYARLMAVDDRFVVLAVNDRKQIESVKAPVLAALRRAPASSDTSLGTLGSILGASLPKLPDRAIAITATEEGDCADCPIPDPASKRDSMGVVFRVSSRSPTTPVATPTP